MSGAAAWPLRSSGAAQSPAARRSLGAKAADLATVYDDHAGGGLHLAREGGDKLVLPVAGNPADAQNLAGADIDRDVLERGAELVRRRC